MNLQTYDAVLSTLSLAVTVILAFFFRTLHSSQRAVERAEKVRDAAVDNAKKDLSEYAKRQHELTDKLMDERFRALSHEVKESVQGVVVSIHDMKDRVDSIDGDADGLREKDHQTQLAIVGKIDQLKDFIRENAASKRDLEKHEEAVGTRFVRMEEKIEKIGIQVATVSTNNPKRQDRN